MFPISCREIHLALLSLIPSILVPPLSASLLPPRSPPLSRVHSCLLVARTSLPAVNGSLFFHPSPLQSTLLSIARATLFILPPPPQLFQKLPSHGRPLVRFSALSSLTRSSRHRDHERTRSLDEEKEDLIVNISSLIFEISSLYPESL